MAAYIGLMHGLRQRVEPTIAAVVDFSSASLRRRVERQAEILRLAC
jgi:hypothetical protein